MNLSLGEAARSAEVSKSTIHRNIKSGKLSAIRKDDGSYEIDPAELHRVFPPGAANGNGSAAPEMRQQGTQDFPGGTGVLERELQQMRERLADKDGVIDDLRRRLDAETEARRTEGEERRKLTAILTDQRPRAAEQRTEQPKGWRGLLIRLAG